MKLKFYLFSTMLIFTLFSASAKSADIEPSVDFKNLEISIPYLGDTKLSVGQFFSAFDVDSSGGSKKWQKDTEASWILTMIVFDKMTNQKHELRFLFVKDKKVAVITRFVAGAKDIPPAYFPNVLLPIIEVAQKKLGHKTFTQIDRQKGDLQE